MCECKCPEEENNPWYPRHEISCLLSPTWVLLLSLSSPLSSWETIFSAHLRKIFHHKYCNNPLPSPIPPYPAGLLLGNRRQLDLLLLDGRIAEVQEALCLLPGLLDGGERGADTEPGGPPVAVHPLCLHWGGGGGGPRRERRWRGGGRRREDGVVTGGSLYPDDGSHSFHRLGSVPPLRRRRPRPSDSPGPKASALIRGGWINSQIRSDLMWSSYLGPGYLRFVQ